MMMSIPCTYVNDVLTIKCLDLKSTGWPVEQAFTNMLELHPEFYADLCEGKIQTDLRERYFIELPHSKKLYDRIIALEPLIEVKGKAKANKDNFLKANAEEVLKYGY